MDDSFDDYDVVMCFVAFFFVVQYFILVPDV